MHKKALECAKKTLEEFCAFSNPTCVQADFFKTVMCGLSEFVNAEYKATIIDEMKEAKEEEELMQKLGMSGEENERMGYNRMRDSRGRYMSGNGRRGYDRMMPMEQEDMYMDRYLDNPMAFKANMRMGYTDNVNGMSYRGNGSRHGENYDMYRDARRHYTETENPKDKEKMEKKAKDTYHDALDVFREMWRDGDAELKAMMRQEIQNFVSNEMI